MAFVNLGRVKQVWKGVYNAGTAYKVDDIVQYTDAGTQNTYICKVASTGNAPSTNGTLHSSWDFQTKSSEGGVFDSSLTIGTAGQALAVNAGATALEWQTITGGMSILAKTANYTIVAADVDGKTETVVSIDVSGGNKTITLPALSAMSATTVLTIIVNVSSSITSGIADYKVVVNQDAADNSGAEIWSGTAKGDFVRMIKMGAAWQVLDNRETFFSRRYMASDQYIDGYNHEHLTAGGWVVYQNSTNSGTLDGNDWGNCWNSSNNEFICPFDCWVDANLSASFPAEANDHGLTASWRINGQDMWRHQSRSSDGRVSGPDGYIRIYQPCTSGWDIEPWNQNMDDNGCTTYGGRSGEVCQLHIRATRRYS
ncbi:MAG: hypothetical protein CMO44_13520 [Verrucomicrobiales bacterium]|mgnify:CR=1 FL=1|nr:hypothetical protein [Verrucomicrobiales bacterium]|tara:strand:+ start:7611 stop:8717 length:1107 start_codon:yes stop_codon:yes gene_type:complete